MSRARNLKPAFFKNEELAELPFEYRMLFQGLWCLADREGRLEDRPKRIKAEVFPYDNVDVAVGLAELERAGFISRYAAGNIPCIQVVNFSKHQNPHCKEAASTIPAPCESGVSREITGTSRADSLNPLTDSLNPAQGARTRRASPESKKAKGETLLAEWLDSLPEGEAAIPADGGAFQYAAKIGLPPEYVALAWDWFKSEMTRRKVRKANWRNHFLQAIEGNWPKYWYADDSGGWGLTTAGKQAQRAAR